MDITGRQACPFRLADIYVGLTGYDFIDGSAFYCRRNVTTNSLNPMGFFGCVQPIKGRYVTIQNNVYHQHEIWSASFPSWTCLSLCDVKVYAKGRQPSGIQV